MIESLIAFIAPALQSQVGGTAIALSLVGAAFALLRSVPGQLASLLRRRVIVSVDVPGNDTLFAWLVVWLDAHPYSRRARLLTATSGERGGGRLCAPGDKIAAPDILFSPAPGISSARITACWMVAWCAVTTGRTSPLITAR